MKISNITQSLSRLNSGANQQQPANYAATKSLKYSSDAADVKPSVVTPVKSRTDDELCAANALVGINFGAGIALPLPLPLPISTPQATPTASQPVEVKSEPTVTNLVTSKIGIPNGQLRPLDAACDADSNESLETSKSEASERQKKNDQTNIGKHFENYYFFNSFTLKFHEFIEKSLVIISERFVKFS